jgi:hypothetical protein
MNPHSQTRLHRLLEWRTPMAFVLLLTSLLSTTQVEPLQTIEDERGELSMTETTLDKDQSSLLDEADGSKRVGDHLALWVSVDEQMLRGVRGGQCLFSLPCSTSSVGVGSEMNSLRTPLGWHSVAEKLGANAPWGQVFRIRRPTEEVWKPGTESPEDLVLSRILVLGGEEPGVNKGGNVDSYARNIYIHGTNDEKKIGVPSSRGCIRLTNDAVIDLFEQVSLKTMVLITDQQELS